jgi:hypothetical protein
MQHASGGGTGAGNVATVLGNFRFMQDDVQQNIFTSNLCKTAWPDACPYIVVQNIWKINRKNWIFSTFTVLQ